MHALTPAIAISAPISVTPVIIAISTIIREAETEYSIHRASLRPFASIWLYQPLTPGTAISR
jgi:hypothetical protein